MKIIYFAIIYLLLLANPSNSNSRKVSQNIHLDPHTHTLVSELEGNVEWVYWDENTVKIETTIQSNLKSDYGIDYSVGSNNYKLIPNFAEQRHTLILRNKKSYPSIIIKGQYQRTRQSYKVFVPRKILHVK